LQFIIQPINKVTISGHTSRTMGKSSQREATAMYSEK